MGGGKSEQVEEKMDLEVEATAPGVRTRLRWVSSFSVPLATALVMTVWCAVYYASKPGPEFLPVALISLALGVVLGQVISVDLRNRLDAEVERRDAEVERLVADRNQLLDRLMTGRESSKGKDKPK